MLLSEPALSERMEMLISHCTALGEQIRQLWEHMEKLDDKIELYWQEIERMATSSPPYPQLPAVLCWSFADRSELFRCFHGPSDLPAL